MFGMDWEVKGGRKITGLTINHNCNIGSILSVTTLFFRLTQFYKTHSFFKKLIYFILFIFGCIGPSLLHAGFL